MLQTLLKCLKKVNLQHDKNRTIFQLFALSMYKVFLRFMLIKSSFLTGFQIFLLSTYVNIYMFSKCAKICTLIAAVAIAIFLKG